MTMFWILLLIAVIIGLVFLIIALIKGTRLLLKDIDEEEYKNNL
jgi:hypothetical protein